MLSRLRRFVAWEASRVGASVSGMSTLFDGVAVLHSGDEWKAANNPALPYAGTSALLFNVWNWFVRGGPEFDWLRRCRLALWKSNNVVARA